MLLFILFFCLPCACMWCHFVSVWLGGLCHFGIAKNPILALHAKIAIFHYPPQTPNPDIAMEAIQIRYRLFVSWVERYRNLYNPTTICRLGVFPHLVCGWISNLVQSEPGMICGNSFRISNFSTVKEFLRIQSWGMAGGIEKKSNSKL